MPCIEGDRSDCHPEASSIARSRRLRAMVVVKGWQTESQSFTHLDHWSVAVVTVTVHYSFFPTFDFFKKYVAFCTGFSLLTSTFFLLPYIIMDLPIFVIAQWATLLVDIHCLRGGS